MDLRIAGRRAAVSASTSGLGLGAAQALAAEGVRIAICGRDSQRLANATDEITRSTGSRPISIIADISDPVGAAGFVERAAVELGGPLDILVTNTGGPPPGAFDSVPIESYVTAFEQHVASVVAMCRQVVPSMVKRGWGRIIGITSSTVRQPMPAVMLSGTARAGATAFFKTLAIDIAESGVTVNTVQPGAHATPRLDDLYTDTERAVMRMGDPDDFGQIVTFLCSEQARFVTGTHLLVDGGRYTGLL